MKFIQERIEDRRQDFKRGIDVDTGVQKRLESTLSLRKNKNLERLDKMRRCETISETKSDPTKNDQEGVDPFQIEGMYSNDPEIALKAIRYFRILSMNKNHDNIIAAGIMDKAISYLSYTEYPDHQYESEWFITNMLSGKSEICTKLIETTSIPDIMINLLKTSNDDKIKNQAIWAIANIAGENDKYADILIQHNIIPDILNFLNNLMNKIANHDIDKRYRSYIDTIVWTLSNLTKSSILTILDTTEILRSISIIVYYTTDLNIIHQVSWIIMNLLKNLSDENHKIVFTTNAFNSELISLLDHSDTKIILPVLRICGNIIAGTHENTQKIIDMGITIYLSNLIHNRNSRISKEVVWIISNLAVKHIDDLFNVGLVDHVLTILPKSNWNIRKECFYTINNIIYGGEPHHVYRLICSGALILLLGGSISAGLNDDQGSSFLMAPDMTIVYETLAVLHKILESFPVKEVKDVIEKYGYEDISSLMYHPDTKISAIASTIIDNHYK
jgi:importin subunit alpha-1